MKHLLLFAILIVAGLTANAQNFKAQQQQQERIIRTAYKNHKVTEKEFAKLMNEQDVIKSTMEKYEADGVLDPHEKNVIHDKLERAAKRLKRYKTNREVY